MRTTYYFLHNISVHQINSLYHCYGMSESRLHCYRIVIFVTRNLKIY